MDPKKEVEAGYDAMAEQYLASRSEDDPATIASLQNLATYLPPGGKVLDLGCGAGIPVTRWLAEQGFQVTGVDISARQLELARERVPGATFIKADMAEVDFPAESFDAVVSFYAIIHVPREEQQGLLGHIYSWLKPGGMFLAIWATGAWEGEEENWQGWGAPMWWSHFSAEENTGMLQQTGFELVSWDTHIEIDMDNHAWLLVLARRPQAGLE